MSNGLSNAHRLAALHKTGLLDSPPEQAYDRVTALIRQLLDVDVALVSLVDKDRQFFKSSDGLPSPWRERRETPLSHSFCQYVVTSGSPLSVEDAAHDKLVCTNSAVTELGVASYLGVPIHSSEGEVLGSLCAIRTRPSQWTPADQSALQAFAKIVEDAIAMRELASLAVQSASTNELLAREFHHRVKNVLAIAGSLVRFAAREAKDVQELVDTMEGRLVALAGAHDAPIEQSNDTDLSALLHRLLKPYQHDHRGELAIDGPPLLLSFKQITPLSLIIHELATNSAKYGAISASTPLAVSWRVENGRTVIEWREASDVKTTGHEAGFGTRLLDIAATQLNGSVVATSTNPLTIVIAFPLMPAAD